jgi:hypothetical protein
MTAPVSVSATASAFAATLDLHSRCSIAVRSAAERTHQSCTNPKFFERSAVLLSEEKNGQCRFFFMEREREAFPCLEAARSVTVRHHGATQLKNVERNKRLTWCQKSEREPDPHVIWRVDPGGPFFWCIFTGFLTAYYTADNGISLQYTRKYCTSVIISSEQ